MKRKVNLKQIKKTNARKLEELLTNPKKVERLAKKEYGKSWKIIYSGERHYNNSQRKAKYL